MRTDIFAWADDKVKLLLRVKAVMVADKKRFGVSQGRKCHDNRSSQEAIILNLGLGLYNLKTIFWLVPWSNSQIGVQKKG